MGFDPRCRKHDIVDDEFIEPPQIRLIGFEAPTDEILILPDDERSTASPARATGGGSVRSAQRR